MSKSVFEKFYDFYTEQDEMDRNVSFPSALRNLSGEELDELENQIQEITEGIENEEPQYGLYNKDFFEDLRRLIPVARKDKK